MITFFLSMVRKINRHRQEVCFVKIIHFRFIGDRSYSIALYKFKSLTRWKTPTSTNQGIKLISEKFGG